MVVCYLKRNVFLSFRRVLGSEEAPLIKTSETAESNDVVEPSARTGTGTNGIPRTTRKTRQTVYQKAIEWLQQAPSHPTCRHKHSCIFYVLQVRIGQSSKVKVTINVLKF